MDSIRILHRARQHNEDFFIKTMTFFIDFIKIFYDSIIIFALFSVCVNVLWEGLQEKSEYYK